MLLLSVYLNKFVVNLSLHTHHTHHTHHAALSSIKQQQQSQSSWALPSPVIRNLADNVQKRVAGVWASLSSLDLDSLTDS